MYKRVIAMVQDDDGAEHEIVAIACSGENAYEQVEREALHRGIRYTNTVWVQYPDGPIPKREVK